MTCRDTPVWALAAAARCERPVLEPMEERILHSADLAAALGLDSMPGAALPARAELRHALSSAAHAAEQQTQPRHEIVFVDAALPGLQTLLDGLRADATRALEVVVVDAGEDGIARIGAELARRGGLDAVHLLSHAEPGALQLGATVLDGATLMARAGEVALWGEALAPDADLMLYGCDLAADSDGRRLVQDLAALTGADVAASVDPTGAAARGGDWELEFARGAVDSAVVAGSALRQQWDATLAVTRAGTVSSTVSAAAVASVSFSHTVDAGSDRVLLVQVATKDGVGVASVSFGSVALQRVGFQDSNASEVRVESWLLVAPAVQTADVVVTLSASSSVAAGAANFEGVDPLAPVGVVVGRSGNAGPISVDLAAAAGDLVVDIASVLRVGSSATGAGQDLLFTRSQGSGNGDLWATSSTEAGAATVTMSHEFTASGGSADKWAAVALRLQQGNALPPQITSAADVAMPENRLAVTTVTASDPEGFGLSYSISGGADADLFTIDAGSGALSYKAAPDFEAPADAEGDNSYEVQVSVSDGRFSDSRLVRVHVDDVPEFDPLSTPGLWISTAGAGTVPGLGWAADELVQFGPTSLGETTDGTFSQLFTLASGVSLNALHVVGSELVIGTTNPVTLRPGELLFSVDAATTLGGVAVGPQDIVHFRPIAPGDYSGGGFAVLARNPDGSGSFVDALTLVERTVTIGGTVLAPGDLLLTLSSKSTEVVRYQLEETGSASSGTASPFFKGQNFDLNKAIGDIALVQQDMVLGGLALGAGQVLVSISLDDESVGTNMLPVDRRDIFAVALTATGGSSTGTASKMCEGVQVGLDNPDEHADAFALLPSAPGAGSAPTITSDGGGASAALTVAENTVGVTIVGATDADADVLFYSVSGGVDAALFTIDGTSGALSFELAPDFEAPSDVGGDNVYEVVVRVSDGAFADTQAISVAVGDVNDAPLVSGAVDLGSIDEDAARAIAAAELIALASDADGAPLSVLNPSIVSGQGTLVADGAGGWIFTPETNWHGAVELAYEVSDGSATVAASATLNVLPVNDAPALVLPIADQTTIEGQPFVLAVDAGSFADVDAGDALTYTATLADGSPLPAWLVFDAGTLVFSGTPSQADIGSQSLRLTATDSAGASAQADFTLTVGAVNDAPVVTGVVDLGAIDEDGTRAIGAAELLALASDADGDPLSVLNPSIASGQGMLVADGAGGWIFTPETNWHGAVELAYEVSDGSATVAASATLNVLPVNDAPNLAQPIADQTAIEAQPFVLAVDSSTFADLDSGDTLTYTATLADGSPLPAWLAFDAGTLVFGGTPGAADIGSLSLRLTATDSAGASAQADFGLRVFGVGAPPVLAMPADQATPAGTALVFSGAGGNSIGVADPDAGSTTLELTLTVTHGTLSLPWPSAPAVADGAQLRVNTTVDGRQSTLDSDGEFYGATTGNFGGPRAVATDRAGGFVVVWSSKDQDGDGWGVYGQRYDAAGQPVGGEFGVSQHAPRDQLHASVAVDDAGRFVVVWSSKDQDGDGWGVYARRFDADGSALGDEFLVNATVAKDQLGPAVAIDAAGDFVVTWSSRDQDGNGWGVYGQRYDAAGVALGGEFRLSQTTDKDQIAASVAMAPDGRFVAAWASKDQDGNNWAVVARRFGADGVALGDEFIVNTTTDKEQLTPSVAIDAQGHFVVAWASKDQDSDNFAIVMQRFGADGVALGGETIVNETVVKEQLDPSVAMNGDGAFVVAWSSRDQDGGGYAVVQRQYDADGVARGAEAIVNIATAGDQRFASAAIDARGNAVVAWAGPGSDDAQGVFARRYLVPAAVEIASGTGLRDASVVLRGSLAEIAALLDGLRFEPEASFEGLALLTATVTDADGGTDSGSLTIAVGDGVLPAASQVGLSGGPLLFVEDDGWTLLDTAATVTDADSADLAGGRMTVHFSANGDGDDRLALLHEGDGAGQIGVDAGNVRYGGVVIGRWEGGHDGATPLVVSFDAGATPEAVQALLRRVAYQNASQAPSTSMREVSVRVHDGDGASSEVATRAIQVVAVDDAPVVAGVVDLGSMDEDGARAIGAAELLALASDVDGDALSVVGLSLVSGQGTLVADGAGGWVFTPDADWHGAVELAYEVSDGSATVAASVTLNVLPVNDAPTLVLPIADQTAIEGQPFVLAVDAGSFADVDAGDTLVYTATLADGSPLPAWLVFDAGTLVFSGTPSQADIGSQSLRLTATDSAGASAQADFTLTVGAVNDAPVVTGVVDLGAIDEDGTRAIGAAELLALASDADGDPLSVLNPSIVSGQGTLVADGAGGWIFTPETNWHGAVELAYEVSDGSATVAASATLNVLPVNDVPALVLPIADQTAIEDQPFVLAVDAGSFAEVDAGDVLTYTATLADGSSLPAWLVFDAGTLVFSGTPSQADLGSLSLRLTASDSAGASAHADFTLTVGAVNDAPVVTGIVDLGSIDEDGTRTISEAELLALASDADGDALTVAGLSIASGQGTLVADGAGGWIFTPDANWHGAVLLAYEVSDGSATVAASATLGVLPVNDAPALVLPIADQAAIEGQPYVLTVDAGSFAEVDAGDTLTYTATLADGSALPVWLGFDAGTLVFSGTPSQADLGSLSLRLTASDSAGASAHAEFTLTVGPVNDAPVVTGIVDLGSIDEDGTRTISAAELLALASDADGDALSVLNPSVASGQGMLAADGAGGWIFTPDANWHGAVLLAYEVSDGSATVAASATLGVLPVNDVPALVLPIADQTAIEDQSYVLTVDAGSFAEVDAGDTLTYTATLADGSALPVWLGFDAGTLVFSGTPSQADLGSLSLRLIATDSAGASAHLDFVLTVGSVNDVPVVTGVVDLGSIDEDGTRTISAAELLALASDADGDALSVLNPSVASGQGTLAADGAGDWIFTPDANWHGAVAFAYEVSDGATSTAASATLGVTASSDPPPSDPPPSDPPPSDPPPSDPPPSDPPPSDPPRSDPPPSDPPPSDPPPSDPPPSDPPPSDPPPSDPPPSDPPPSDPPPSDPPPSDPPPSDPPPSDPPPSDPPPSDPPAPDSPRPPWRPSTGDVALGGTAWSGAQAPGADASSATTAAPSPSGPAPSGVDDRDAPRADTPADAQDDDDANRGVSAPRRLHADAEPAAGRTDREGEAAVAAASTSVGDDARASPLAAWDAIASWVRGFSTGAVTVALPDFEQLALRSVRAFLGDDELLRRFQRLEEQAGARAEAREVSLASGVALTSALSIGYVVWLVRGGVLLSSVLSTLPAWQLLDPLPVLARARNAADEDGDGGDGGDAVERLFDDDGQAGAGQHPPGAPDSPSTPPAVPAVQPAERATQPHRDPR